MHTTALAGALLYISGPVVRPSTPPADDVRKRQRSVGPAPYHPPMTGAAVMPSGLTWEQFVELLDEPDYKNAELIDGQVVVNTPSWMHQRIATNLLVVIGNWIRAGTGRGEVTFNPPVRITHNRGYVPDVAWYREDRCVLAGRENRPDGPPDLAVGVLSPSTKAFDVVRKRADYARVGVGELWLVDPDGPAALILRPPAEATTPGDFVVVGDLDVTGELMSPQLPGLAIRVGNLLTR